jgi:hypothetical protein
MGRRKRAEGDAEQLRSKIPVGASASSPQEEAQESTVAKGATTAGQVSVSALPEVQDVIDQFVTEEFLQKERQLSKKDTAALLAFVHYVVASCPENPLSSAFTPSTSPLRAEAEKTFRRRTWEYLVQPRHTRLLHRECADALAASYIRLSAQIPWKQLSRCV